YDPDQHTLYAFAEDTGDDHTSLVAIDVATGRRTRHVLSDGSYRSLVWDGGQSRLLLSRKTTFALDAFDPLSGQLTPVSSSTLGAGPLPGDAEDMILDATGQTLYVASNPYLLETSVIAIDVATGDRAIVSSDNVGVGPAFQGIYGLAWLDATTLVATASGRVLTVDIASGDRATLAQNGVRGDGVGPVSPRGVHVAGDTLLVVDSAAGLIAIDVTSGDRTRLLNNEALSQPSDLVAIGDGTLALLAEDDVLRYTVSDGALAPLSVAHVGSGPRLWGGTCLAAIDPDTLVSIGGDLEVVTIDLARGDRTPLAGALPSLPAYDCGFDGSSVVLLLGPGGGAGGSLLHVDPLSGEPTVHSADDIGTGPIIGKFTRLAVDGATAYVADPTHDDVLRVDAQGNRTAIASPVMGDGIYAFSHDPASSRLLITLDAASAIYVALPYGAVTAADEADPLHTCYEHAFSDDGTLWGVCDDGVAAGLFSRAADASARTSVSTSTAHHGPLLRNPSRLVMRDRAVAYVLENALRAVFAIDVATGQRVIVSK
ncbi:MAG: PQQ-binding-like beta-propeller repeat protein, partial [Myxococcales bacterium]|nr:PQQ-binding-like beta-propeller repeat protein [Myxococcales bacterium]